jgi:mono/diheme cytochrome c family protein
MRRLFLSLPVLALGGLAVFWGLTRPGTVPADELAGLTGDAVAGEAVFWAAGCASCHAGEDATGEARLILSGGQRFPSDFGTFVAPNISMHPEQGIGDWTFAQFVTALQEGTSPEGRHYYPAFPYPAYRLATRQDLADLWAFWQTLPASDAANQPHELGFPFSIRRTVGVWNLLNLRDDFAVTGTLTEAEARGRYLSEALAHCAECHTPRGFLGALDRGAWLTGAPDPSGRGTIPALTPDALTWSEAEIAAYLNDGFTPEFDSAGGHMVSVIRNLSQLPESDRLAIAAYLKALPEAAEDGTIPY